MKYFLFAFTYFLLPFTLLAQGDDELPNLIAKVRASVVLVVTYDAAGNRLSRGTGFFVEKNRIVTNKHVVRGASRVEIRTASDETFKTRIESVDQSGDLALLQLEEAREGTIPLRLALVSPRPGERVIVVGNPLGLEGSVADGIVSAFRDLRDVGKLVQITAPISQGSSGSPVINMKGEVVGVATLYLEGGQNLNFAISSERIRELWSPTAVGPATIGNGQPATRWRMMTQENNFYDSETVVREASIVTVWVRWNKDTGRYSKSLMQIDCKRSLSRELRDISYDVSGEVLSSKSIPTRWQGPVPDSVGEAINKVFCDPKVPDFQETSDSLNRSETRHNSSVLARELKEKGEYGSALEVYRRLSSEYPTERLYRLSIPGLLIDLGRLGEAKTELLSFLVKNPSDSWARTLLSNLAHKFWDAGNLSDAKELYFRLFRLDSSDFLMLKLLLEELKDKKGLTEMYDLLFKTTHLPAFPYMVKFYVSEGQTAKAAMVTKRGTVLLENKIRGSSPAERDFDVLSDIYKAAGQKQKAVSVLEKGIRRWPKSWKLHFALGLLYSDQELWELSISSLKEALDRSEKKHQKEAALRGLVVAFKKLGRIEEATKAEEALKPPSILQ